VASSGRTYESLRTAAQIVLHYYVRGGERADDETAGEGVYIRSIRPPRNYPLCIA